MESKGLIRFQANMPNVTEEGMKALEKGIEACISGAAALNLQLAIAKRVFRGVAIGVCLGVGLYVAVTGGALAYKGIKKLLSDEDAGSDKSSQGRIARR